MTSRRREGVLSNAPSCCRQHLQAKKGLVPCLEQYGRSALPVCREQMRSAVALALTPTPDPALHQRHIEPPLIRLRPTHNIVALGLVQHGLVSATRHANPMRLAVFEIHSLAVFIRVSSGHEASI